jgi:hypothetical protein
MEVHEMKTVKNLAKDIAIDIIAGILIGLGTYNFTVTAGNKRNRADILSPFRSSDRNFINADEHTYRYNLLQGFRKGLSYKVGKNYNNNIADNRYGSADVPSVQR